jgi:hypothetical protein
MGLALGGLALLGRFAAAVKIVVVTHWKLLPSALAPRVFSGGVFVC